jgi:hypothetical protein
MERMFEIAARDKYRFETSRGEIMVEDLYDLPLKTKRTNSISLDAIARNLYIGIKEEDEISFVDSVPNTARIEMENKLEIVKYIIKMKKEELAEKQRRIEAKGKNDLIDKIIIEKEQDSLKELSIEDLKKLKSAE